MYIIGQILISRRPSCVAVNRAWVLTHLPGPSIGPGSASFNIHAMLRRFAWRRPAVSVAPSASRQAQAQVSIPAVAYWSPDLRRPGPSIFRDFFIPVPTFGGGVSLGDRKPNMGRKYALLAGPSTPLYNVTLTLFEEVPPTL